MLTEEGVVAAYRLLLGRAPESEAMIRSYVEHASFDTLRKTILESAEFANRVATQPDIANLHPSILGAYPATRLGCRQLEHLASLGLPIWGRTVICPGGGSGLIPSFFVDRFCKVTIPAIDGIAGAATKIQLQRVRRTEANESPDVVNLDLCSAFARENSGCWQVVASYGAQIMPKRMETYLANLSRLCSGILVLEIKVGFGGSESFTVERKSVDGVTTEIAIPTRQWVWATLTRDFAHVYLPRTQPCHEEYALDWSGGYRKSATSRAVFVAARFDLDETTLSPSLLATQTMQL